MFSVLYRFWEHFVTILLNYFVPCRTYFKKKSSEGERRRNEGVEIGRKIMRWRQMRICTGGRRNRGDRG
jgi:hypothetical protein